MFIEPQSVTVFLRIKPYQSYCIKLILIILLLHKLTVILRAELHPDDLFKIFLM